jgi:hypothetical protein
MASIPNPRYQAPAAAAKLTATERTQVKTEITNYLKNTAPTDQPWVSLQDLAIAIRAAVPTVAGKFDGRDLAAALAQLGYTVRP